MPVRHDQIHKDLIRAFPADLIRIIAPQLAQKLELDGLAFQPEEHFVEGKERRLDLVARIPCRNRPGERITFHVEVEGKFRDAMANRLFNYNRLLTRADKNPVHSAVLFLRGGPPGIQRVTWLEESLGLEICAFHYHCLGLSRTTPRDLLDRDEPLAWALATRIRRRSPTLQAEHCLACLRRIVNAPDLDDQRRQLLVDYVQTYVESSRGVEHELAKIYALYDDRKEVRTMATMITTWSERLQNQGRQQGRTQVLEELRDRLSRRLSERFGALSASVSDRLAKITSLDKLLDLWERAFTARSLDELGLTSRS